MFDFADQKVFTNFAELPGKTTLTSAVEAAVSFDTCTAVLAGVGLAGWWRHWRRQKVKCLLGVDVNYYYNYLKGSTLCKIYLPTDFDNNIPTARGILILVLSFSKMLKDFDQF